MEFLKNRASLQKVKNPLPGEFENMENSHHIVHQFIM